MHAVAVVLLLVVAVLHLGFLALEMFLWATPRGRGVFGTEPAFAEESKTLAANQGLYNGFLAAGCVWGALAPAHLFRPVGIFFTVCVVIAGLYGAATVSRRILLVQALPGAVALVLVLLA